MHETDLLPQYEVPRGQTMTISGPITIPAGVALSAENFVAFAKEQDVFVSVEDSDLGYMQIVMTTADPLIYQPVQGSGR